MKKFISLLLCITLLLAFSPLVFSKENVQPPVIVETVYPTDDVVIADIILTEVPYSADNTGNADVTAVLQKAIDDCAANGGGTVWLPEGEYRLTGNVYIRQFVTVRGEYQDPDEGKEYGTVIIADVPSEDIMTPGLFTVGASAGAVGLTVWYPEQDIENVKPYPYTFYAPGNADYMLNTIKNCTLINSYRGIGACSECENDIYQCHEMLTIENVKGTCLYEGLNSYNSADVDTVKTLYIDNKYWAEAGEAFNAPEEKLIDDLRNIAKAEYQKKEEEFGFEKLREIERIILLRVVDSKWMDHIDDMERLRQGIGLRAYAQRDPIIEYKEEGYIMYEAMLQAVNEDIIKLLFHVRLESSIERKQVAKPTTASGGSSDGTQEAKPVVRTSPKIGRNDPCPCGSGLKYKKCCGR